MSKLKQWSEGLWTVDFPFSMSGIQLGTRSTLVRTEQGLVVISPGPFDSSLKREIDEIGAVVALVAPNKMHHLFMESAQRLWPEAQVWLAPGLEKKRPELAYHEILSGENSPFPQNEVEHVLVEGMPKLNETVFFHSASGTLILTDLAFNFCHCGHWLTRLFLKFNGALGTFGPTRVMKGYFLEDRELFGKAVSRLLEWPIERVILAHGEVLVEDAREAVSLAFKGFAAA